MVVVAAVTAAAVWVGDTEGEATMKGLCSSCGAASVEGPAVCILVSITACVRACV
jgi:hypothetical protein